MTALAGCFAGRLTRMAVLALTAGTAIALSGCGGSGSATGESRTYPAEGKPVHLLVGFSAGGSTDLAARLLAQRFEEKCGISTVVENLPTGGGLEALSRLANAKPDGYTVALAALPSTNMLYLDPERRASFAREDLQPVVTHDASPLAIAVAANSPYRTLGDLITAAKENSASVTTGSNGVLAAGHLALLELNKLAGTDIAWTTFQESGLLRTALLKGDVQFEINGMAELAKAAKSGELRLLATLTKERLTEFPDIPTAHDNGVDLQISSTRVVTAPKGTSKEVTSKLSECVEQASLDPDYQAAAEKLGLRLAFANPAETEAIWAKADDTYKPLVSEFRGSK